ncbi:major capsid protein [Cricetid gammaherpesvirus 2]|uniref:Major capsid protein n=1 Tax=Cricetid gammaherpesvirus 2 TaxID=1605972 RepID=E9M5K8_9GAMA|nr:major capsid protein [Cricetid gammaherpesvirus 2]ADW24366.1 major capsid protein [Cricetid gammaherpesvirus 2]ADW24448.1 major capsid protein [Cricetid gammaherpesvirus 2]
MAGPSVDLRHLPYVVTDANLTHNIKQSAAEGLFKSFQLLVGKDARENAVKFEALLGVYTNAVQFVKFIETGLAISCVNTEFKDLRKMVEGKIQFKVSIPTIAHGDGRRPNKQRQYIVMRACQKYHITAEIELSTEDIQLLFAEHETPLDFTEHVGAIKTITHALQFGVDALERGLINTVLHAKLRNAPPAFILRAINNPNIAQRPSTKASRADIISLFKKELLENSFFLDTAATMPRPKDYVLSILSNVIGAVANESVFRSISQHTTEGGETIFGVLETTDSVMRRLIALIGQAYDKVRAPASYANYVVRGGNVVTAVSYGQVMKNFDSFLARLIDGSGNSMEADFSDYNNMNSREEMLERSLVPVPTIRVGERVVAVESLQRMYREAQDPYPLARSIQYTYYFPVGLFLPSPRYSTSQALRGLEIASPPTDAWIMNKNNLLLCFGYQTALRSICHPRMHTPVPTIQVLDAQPANPAMRPRHNYGVRSIAPNTMNLYRIIYMYYNYRQPEVSDIARKSQMPPEELFGHGAVDQLMLELHPLFDFFRELNLDGNVAHRASHRVHVGNIPKALAPADFQEGRGHQFETATGMSHVIDASTMEVIQETAFDPSYPPMCYLMEACIHGQEEKFILNMEFIALIIETYWTTSGHLAFVNNFYMIKYICKHMGAGMIRKEIYTAYRKIMGELMTMANALLVIGGHERVAQMPVAEMISSLLDSALPPPVAYNNIFNELLGNEHRNVRARVGERILPRAQLMNLIRIIESMEDAADEFNDLYNARRLHNPDNGIALQLGPDTQADVLMEKLFYYVFLPVCTNGHMCGMGVIYENLENTVAFNEAVFMGGANGNDQAMRYLRPGALRDILVASEIRPTIAMLRMLTTCLLTFPFSSQLVRIAADKDYGQNIAADVPGTRIQQSVLVNGFVGFFFSEKSKQLLQNIFYPVPFHKFYSDPSVAATMMPAIAEYLANNPGQKNGVVFNVPPQLMAEYEEWHRSPMLAYVLQCDPAPAALSALLAMHLKLSPVGFISMARSKIHPGVAMTVVRTDEVLSENVLYSSKASTSVFIGRPVVNRREARTDAVTFDINNELASLDTSMGYNSTIIPATATAVTTDMGIHCQDLFGMYPTDAFRQREFHNYVKQKAGADGTAPAPVRDPLIFMAGDGHRSDMPGLYHGQVATCEVILTPVTADVAYFQSPNSPRGRAGCVVSCDTYSPDNAVKLLYDHSLPDPAYEFRATNNPWASQAGSLGDTLYNNVNRQLVTPGMYSPCRQYFNRDQLLKNNKCLHTLVGEYSSRIGGSPATSNTDIQYVLVNGTDVFLDQPCLLLQEAYPTLSASHKGLIDELMSHKKTHAPVHHGQYLLEEVAPLKRVLKIGNKVV